MGIISRGFTGRYRPRDRILEAPPLAISEQGLKIARAPIFGAVVVDARDPLDCAGAKDGSRNLMHFVAMFASCSTNTHAMAVQGSGGSFGYRDFEPNQRRKCCLRIIAGDRS